MRRTTGPRSLWRTWRRALPSRADLDQASRTRITAWLGFAGPEASRTETAATIALELFDGVVSSGRAAGHLNGRARDLLECAALCRVVGAPRGRGGAKKSVRNILEQLPKLVEWPPSDVSMIALLVRHHGGRTPPLDDPTVAALPPEVRETFLVLLGVMRFAVVLDSIRPEGPVTA